MFLYVFHLSQMESMKSSKMSHEIFDDGMLVFSLNYLNGVIYVGVLCKDDKIVH